MGGKEAQQTARGREVWANTSKTTPRRMHLALASPHADYSAPFVLWGVRLPQFGAQTSAVLEITWVTHVGTE